MSYSWLYVLIVKVHFDYGRNKIWVLIFFCFFHWINKGSMTIGSDDNFIFFKVQDISKVIGTHDLILIHTLRVHYAHAAANLNWRYSKYVKVAHVHYFCTIALLVISNTLCVTVALGWFICFTGNCIFWMIFYVVLNSAKSLIYHMQNDRKIAYVVYELDMHRLWHHDLHKWVSYICDEKME